jgi:hypothetical protein
MAARSSVIMQPASGACTGIAYASFSGGAARCRVCLHFDYTGSGCEEGGGRKCAGSVLIAFMYGVHLHTHCCGIYASASESS